MVNFNQSEDARIELAFSSNLLTSQRITLQRSIIVETDDDLMSMKVGSSRHVSTSQLIQPPLNKEISPRRSPRRTVIEKIAGKETPRRISQLKMVLNTTQTLSDEDRQQGTDGV